MDVLDAPGHVLAGYSTKRPIPDEEFSILKVSSHLLTIVSNVNNLLNAGLHCGEILPIARSRRVFLLSESRSLLADYGEKRMDLPKKIVGGVQR